MITRPDNHLACLPVRMFLDNGASEVGDYLLSPDGNMIEVASFANLANVSSRFRYVIKAQYQ